MDGRIRLQFSQWAKYLQGNASELKSMAKIFNVFYNKSGNLSFSSIGYPLKIPIKLLA